MIHRVNCEPCDEELQKLIIHDPLGRNQDINAMLNLLQNIEGGLSIFLDGNWGTGKTYFVRSLKLAIDALNAANRESESDLARLFECERTWEQDYLPIYFNAWHYDYWDDPLAPIALTLASETDSAKFVTEDSDGAALKAAAISLVETILNSVFTGLGTALASAGRTIQPKDLLESFKSRNRLREQIVEVIDGILQERANKLILIVDELDRCEPKFACKLLEEFKALFELDNVVVLYALNVKQLACVIEAQYGANFDGRRYLSKFYDLQLPIRTIAMDDYLTYKTVNPGNLSSITMKAVIEAHGMSLRETNRLIDCCKGYTSCLSSQYPTNETLFVIGFILIIASGIRAINPTDYDRLINHGDESIFVTGISQSAQIKMLFKRLISPCLNPQASEQINQDDAFANEVVRAVALLAWNKQFQEKQSAFKLMKQISKGGLIEALESCRDSLSRLNGIRS